MSGPLLPPRTADPLAEVSSVSPALAEEAAEVAAAGKAPPTVVASPPGVVVGPGCVLAMNTPDETVSAVVRALGGPLKPVPGIRFERST